MQETEHADQGERFNKIVTHDDFDGVVSAALCSLAEGVDSFRFCAPGAILEPGLGVDADTIVCDLPHHPAAGLWFDHHVGNLEDYRLKGGDPESICGAFAPEKSCARVVYNYYADKFKFPDFLTQTVKEADTLDSFDYKDIEDWQKETPGKLLADTFNISFPTLREKIGYLRRLIRAVRALPLEEILKDPEIQQKVHLYKEVVEKNRVQIERFAAFLPDDPAKEVILIDTSGLKHAPVLIKSLAFLSFPEAKAVLEVKCLFRQKRKTNDLAFSMSLSPRLEVQSSEKDVGEIMRSLNMGDGHRGAGAGRMACKSKGEMLKRKEAVINEIFSLWRNQQ